MGAGLETVSVIGKQRSDFKVARLALRVAAGRSATRPTKFGYYRTLLPLAGG
jgi:hypothetical protein